MNRTLATVLVLTFAAPTLATNLRPIVPAAGYQHDRFQTMPKDIHREFRAYVTSFDSDDDDNGDGVPDAWGIPQWVSYELRAAPDPDPRDRPIAGAEVGKRVELVPQQHPESELRGS